MSKVKHDLRLDVFAGLQSGPMTTFELASALGQPVRTLATICARMEKDGCLKHTGPRKKIHLAPPGGCAARLSSAHSSQRPTAPINALSRRHPG